jgi:hypothetical protein
MATQLPQLISAGRVACDFIEIERVRGHYCVFTAIAKNDVRVAPETHEISEALVSVARDILPRRRKDYATLRLCELELFALQFSLRSRQR